MIFNKLNYKFLLRFILSIIISAKSAHFISFHDIQKIGVLRSLPHSGFLVTIFNMVITPTLQFSCHLPSTSRSSSLELSGLSRPTLVARIYLPCSSKTYEWKLRWIAHQALYSITSQN